MHLRHTGIINHRDDDSQRAAFPPPRLPHLIKASRGWLKGSVEILNGEDDLKTKDLAGKFTRQSNTETEIRGVL